MIDWGQVGRSLVAFLINMIFVVAVMLLLIAIIIWSMKIGAALVAV